MKDTLLSIGIPAYNEEQNIKNLLESLKMQKIQSARLAEILVISDGSTDKTVELIKSIDDRRIKMNEYVDRRGLAPSQNEIVRMASGDILILLDADVLPTEDSFIEEIIRPIMEDPRVGLVGANTISARPRTFFESIISFSHDFKNSLYQRINKGDNIYLCHGRARAFRKQLYKQIHWSAMYAEDAYSYLRCKELGYKFIFARDAAVLFRSPDNLRDHVKQSKRFLLGREQLEKSLSFSIVRKNFHIPFSVFLASIPEFILKNPFKMLGYFLVAFYVRFFSSYVTHNHSVYEISYSSKKVLS